MTEVAGACVDVGMALVFGETGSSISGPRRVFSPTPSSISPDFRVCSVPDTSPPPACILVFFSASPDDA
uniref:Uncharacterized protein n=1 Tax=Heterorhabditis bacteriophora TaxID=37862 RepID=A0A1I7XQ18_HETBA